MPDRSRKFHLQVRHPQIKCIRKQQICYEKYRTVLSKIFTPISPCSHISCIPQHARDIKFFRWINRSNLLVHNSFHPLSFISQKRTENAKNRKAFSLFKHYRNSYDVSDTCNILYHQEIIMKFYMNDILKFK